MTQSREDMSHADVNSSDGEENGFNKEEIGRLRSLLDSLEKSKDEKEALRKYLAKEFEIKDLGKLKYFLGIEVAWSKEGIFVSQQKYVNSVVEFMKGEPNHILAEFMKGEPTDKRVESKASIDNL
ncbi:hypothetical protein RJ639_037229 [Escallonia herrerae]|uniref:Reverse transcriptase Ty1/copia-type domain-containing protein n=1 Tax=Escallonia herrerae TaxID=1293975 RepID=A0AA88WQ13_9ASTE|nr:hypothetical protein RJ639_037229 [Escallonia herrerae]